MIPCDHKSGTPHYDFYSCNACGWLKPCGQHRYGQNNGWFPSMEAVKAYDKFKTYPGMGEVKPMMTNPRFVAADAAEAKPVADERETEAWLIEWHDTHGHRKAVFQHNCVADYRAMYEGVTSTELIRRVAALPASVEAQHVCVQDSGKCEDQTNLSFTGEKQTTDAQPVSGVVDEQKAFQEWVTTQPNEEIWVISAWQAWKARAALSSNQVAAKPEGKDAERLDFVISNTAWIQAAKLDHPVVRYQLFTQNEDEEYIVLSGEGKSFETPRAAIDAAIQQSKN
jgi:hypothetical protein